MLRRPMFALFAIVLVLGGCAKNPTNSYNNYIKCDFSGREIIENVGDRIFFATDSAVPSPDALKILDRQAAFLHQFIAVSLIIEGHADERGTREYNLALGERRANAARNYLIGRGIAASRINIISYGKERPEALGSDELSLARNRRAVSNLQ